MNRLTRVDFEDIVKQAIDGLPPAIRKRMENVAVVIEDLASSELVDGLGLSGPYDLLGLYQGVSIDRRGFFYGNVLPDKITLFQKAIESKSRSKRSMVRQIREVVLHEIGHYFGLNDRQLNTLFRGEGSNGSS